MSHSTCWIGGRQGLKSIQDFPEDFDGVVAGAPGNQWNNIIDNLSHVFSITGVPSSPTFVPQDAWLNIIHPDLMKQCDAIDKVEDGVIEDPSLCNYDPSGIVCSGSGDNSSCITAEQTETVKKVFSPFFIDNQFIQSRLVPGSEIADPLAIALTGDVAGFSTVSSVFRILKVLSEC
jgi:feruloyl esterase